MSELISPFRDEHEAKDYLRMIAHRKLLQGYDPKDVIIFVNDIIFVFNVAVSLDGEMGHVSKHVEKMITSFKDLVQDFNKKYRNIIFKAVVDLDVRITINIIDPLDYVTFALKQLEEVKSVDETSSRLRAHLPDGTIDLVKEDKLRLLYHRNDMEDPRSPEFMFCLHFGMKDGFDKSIDLKKYGKKFAFDHYWEGLGNLYKK